MTNTAPTTDFSRTADTQEQRVILKRRIKQEREARHWSYAKLATQVTRAGLNMKKGTVYYIEEESREVTGLELFYISKAFEVEIDALLKPFAPRDDTPEMPPELIRFLAGELLKHLGFKGDTMGDYWIGLAENMSPAVMQTHYELIRKGFDTAA